MMQFEIPKERPSIIKVIGVGGGGSNAVNHMYRLGIKGVDFMICNTDHQALEMSPVPLRVQLGPSLTDGRGAGSIPEIGKNAAIENLDEIKEILAHNTKMVFITAGMGGGTGTGAAPIIAGLAKEMGILTVAIVTIPFSFEGKKRKAQADAGIEELKQNVDTLLVICNDRLREIHGNLKLSEAFTHADDVLSVAAKSIAETITKTLHVNVDFADVQTVLKESGVAIMGSAYSEGEDRALAAIMSALDSPLLNDNNIEGARYILLNITSGTKEVTMDELGQITDYIQEQAGNSAEVIMGVGSDENLGEKVGVTVIATGFKTKDQLSNIIPEKKEKVVFNLIEDPAPVAEMPVTPVAPELHTAPVVAKQVVPVAAPLIAEKQVEAPKAETAIDTTPVTEEVIVTPVASIPAENVTENEVAEAPIVHQLIDEEEETPVKEEENDGFVLRVVENVAEETTEVTPENSIESTEEVVAAAPIVIEEQVAVAPAAEVTEEENVKAEELASNESVAQTPIQITPTAIQQPPVLNEAAEIQNAEHTAEVIQEEENTFVFEVNNIVEAEINDTPESVEVNEPVMAAPAAPEMNAIPPVEPPAAISEQKQAEEEDNQEAFMKARARIMQLRELSMKMNSSNGLADLEKEPAYKRRNVQLSNLPEHDESQISRYTLSNDQDNKPEIKPNNPFLHDRVD